MSVRTFITCGSWRCCTSCAGEREQGAASALGIDPRAVASCMKTGRLSWWVREALERELQSGAGSAAAQQQERNYALEGRIEELE